MCYAQRVNAAGVPQWAPNGVALSTSVDPGPPAIAPDGSGGAYVVYAGDGSEPRIQRVDASGAPQWGANGVQLTTSTSVRHMSVIDAGGAGGAIAVWRDDNGAGGLPDIRPDEVLAAACQHLPADAALIELVAYDRTPPRASGSTEPAYTALYEIEGPEVLTSAAWGRAVEEGRWPGQVRPHTLNRRHVLYRRV